MGYSFFEILMLICFGFAWPVDIYKSIKSRSTKGKSLPFLLVIVAGYAFGIVHKLIHSKDFVMFLYLLNALMVSTDIVLYFRNKRLERS